MFMCILFTDTDTVREICMTSQTSTSPILTSGKLLLLKE